jgi:hypothetical protein
MRLQYRHTETIRPLTFHKNPLGGWYARVVYNGRQLESYAITTRGAAARQLRRNIRRIKRYENKEYKARNRNWGTSRRLRRYAESIDRLIQPEP